MAQRAQVGELTLAYEERGEGESVVLFVHGLGGSANTWLAQQEACAAAGYRAIAYDQRGAGRSTKAPGPYSVELWAEDLERFCDALGLERVALVGHSVGTMIAAHGALRLGDRAWALVAIGGALRWRAEAAPVFPQRAELARAGRMDEIAEAVAVTGLSEAGRRQRPELHGLFLELIASNDPECYAQWALATGSAEMRDPARVACPTLALAGEHDPVTPAAFAEALAGAVSSGRADTVPGAAHWCQIEAPQAVNERLIGFLHACQGRLAHA